MMGVVCLYAKSYGVYQNRILLCYPPLSCALYQGIANLKHEKLLLMKVTWKAYKSIPYQPVN